MTLGVNKMPTEAQTVAYKNFMKIYDGVEHLVKIAEYYKGESEPHLKHLQKMVDVVEKNTQNLLDVFFDHVENGKELGRSDKIKLEKAAKEINMAVQQYLVRLSAH